MTKVFFLILLLLGNTARAADLTVVLLEGDGAFNNIKRKVGGDIRVEVRDEDGRPVADAMVVFTAPSIGATVRFPKEHVFQARSDTRGQAVTLGLKPNSVEGRFNIRVEAESDGRRGTAVVTQTNTLAGGLGVPPPSGNEGGGKKAMLFSILAGAAAGGIFFATHR